MTTTETVPLIPQDLKAELTEALDQLSKGIRDPEAARKSRERMDRIREENRQLFGEQNCVVEIIRKMRDGQ